MVLRVTLDSFSLVADFKKCAGDTSCPSCFHNSLRFISVKENTGTQRRNIAVPLILYAWLLNVIPSGVSGSLQHENRCKIVFKWLRGGIVSDGANVKTCTSTPSNAWPSLWNTSCCEWEAQQHYRSSRADKLRPLDSPPPPSVSISS